METLLLGKVLFVNVHPSGYPFAQMLPLTFSSRQYFDHNWDVTLINSLPKDSGYTLVQREDRAKLSLPVFVNDYQAIIITGSSYASYARLNKEGKRYLVSWKRDLIAFIKAAGEQQIPIFGVCFGAQMLAEALGGAVQKGKTTEMGWSLVHKNTFGINEQLLCDVPSSFSAPENHADWITRLPENAVLLAESSGGVQAFRSGIHLGVEFHPERTPDEVHKTLTDAVDTNSKRLLKSGQSMSDNEMLLSFYCKSLPNMFHTFLRYAWVQ